MSYKLQIRAFFFNAKTDYLPYYKNFIVNVPHDASAKNILEQIQIQNENFSYPALNLAFRINNLVLEGDTSVKKIIEEHESSIMAYNDENGAVFKIELSTKTSSL